MTNKGKYPFIVLFQTIFVYINVLNPGTLFQGLPNGTALSTGAMTIIAFLGGWFLFSIFEKVWMTETSKESKGV